jgi:hypothetical protein
LDKRYECLLEAAGYRLKLTVFAAHPTVVETLARQKAAERLKQVYGLTVSQNDFQLLLIQEK